MKTHTMKWSQPKDIHRLLPILGIMIAVCLLAVSTGCKESTTEPSSSGQISMTAKYTTQDATTTIVSTENATVPGAVDSLRITRVRLVLRDIKFKTQSDSSNFRATPFVLELNLSSVIQEISVASVPYGTYRKIEFDVHRIKPADISSYSASEQAQFQDFLNGTSDGYSIVVNGTSYTAGISLAFTFKSIVNVKQKIDLSPEIVISQPSPAVNATMFVSSGGWFKSSTGVLLDPGDPLNENKISDNIRASIKVFKDNNKDGFKDGN